MQCFTRPGYRCWAACLLVGLTAAVSRAASQPADEAVEAPNPPATPAAEKGLRVQPFDDPVQPLDPVRPRTEAEQKKLDALALYLTGRIQERRNDFRGAYDSFKKAVELDPNATAVYRELVPLAFRLNRNDDAVQFAFKAVELDPDDYGLLRRLGVFLASQRRIPDAIKLLEQATESNRIDKTSGDYVTIHRDLGILYGAMGEQEKAAAAYEVVFDALINPKKYDIDLRTRAALEIDPNTSFERLGQIFLDAKKVQLAIQAFERAEKSGRGKPGNLGYNLARVYFQTDQHQKALDHLQKYFDAQLQSKGRDAYELLADILQAMKKSDELIGRLENIAEKDSRNALVQLYLADQYLAAERLDDAEALYQKALKSATDPSGYLGLAAVYRRRNQPVELLEALSKAIGGTRTPEELLSNFTQLESEINAIQQDEKLLESLIAAGRRQSVGEEPKLDFAGSFILAKLAGEARKTEAAVEFYRYALKTRPDKASAVYGELGSHLVDVDNYAEAAKVFREAVEESSLADERPNWQFRLSQALEMAGKTDEALQAIREARKRLPDHPLLHYQEAWIHYHARNWDKAVPLFEEVIDKYTQPQFKEIVRRCQFSLSNIYVQQGNSPKGEAILEKILEEDPDDPSVNNDLGYLWADAGKNLQRAEKMIRKAIAAEPENPAYLDSMGWVLYRLGKFDEAVTFLEKAVSLPSGSDSTIWEHLGDCYQSLEKPEKAADAWRRALDDAKKQPRLDEDAIQRLEQKLKPQ